MEEGFEIRHFLKIEEGGGDDLHDDSGKGDGKRSVEGSPRHNDNEGDGEHGHEKGKISTNVSPVETDEEVDPYVSPVQTDEEEVDPLNKVKTPFGGGGGSFSIRRRVGDESDVRKEGYNFEEEKRGRDDAEFEKRKHRLEALKQFFAHPGTWVFLVLLLIAIGVIIAYVAPVLLAAAALPLMVLAGVATGAAVITAIKYINENFIDFFSALKNFSTWVRDNKGKAALAALAVALLITAAVLTGGFFAAGGVLAVGVGGTVVATSGSAFGFMAPVFAAIAAPFAGLSAAAVGAATFTQAGLAAVVGVTFLTTPLWLTNTLDRIRAFFSKDGDVSPDKMVEHDVSRDKVWSAPLSPSLNPTLFNYLFQKGKDLVNGSKKSYFELEEEGDDDKTNKYEMLLF